MKREEKKMTPFKVTEKALIINGQEIPLKLIHDVRCETEQANPALPMSAFLGGLICFLFTWQVGAMICLISLAWVFAKSPSFHLVIETPKEDVKVWEEEDEKALKLMVKSIRADLMRLQERKIKIQREKAKEKEMRKFQDNVDKIFFSV